MRPGINKRVERLLGGHLGVPIFCPIDDSLLAGPFDGLRNMEALVHELVVGKPSAIIGFKGSLSRFNSVIGAVPTILNCSASIVGPNHVTKKIIHTIEDGLWLGVDAVAVHLNLTSDDEVAQLSQTGLFISEAERVGLPVLVIAYPRRSRNGVDDNYLELKTAKVEEYAKLVAWGVRIAVELGASIVKTQYTGSMGSFTHVVDAAMGVPVVVAGGPKRDAQEILLEAREAVNAGAAGISFGRNVFNRSNPGDFIRQLRAELVVRKEIHE